MAAQGGGVILLKKGDFLISKTIFLKSNVVLRGENEEQTVLKVVMKKMFFRYVPDQKHLVAFEINNAERVDLDMLPLILNLATILISMPPGITGSFLSRKPATPRFLCTWSFLETAEIRG